VASNPYGGSRFTFGPSLGSAHHAFLKLQTETFAINRPAAPRGSGANELFPLRTARSTRPPLERIHDGRSPSGFARRIV
jgi:hypothetical protein